LSRAILPVFLKKGSKSGTDRGADGPCWRGGRCARGGPDSQYRGLFASRTPAQSRRSSAPPMTIDITEPGSRPRPRPGAARAAAPAPPAGGPEPPAPGEAPTPPARALGPAPERARDRGRPRAAGGQGDHAGALDQPARGGPRGGQPVDLPALLGRQSSHAQRHRDPPWPHAGKISAILKERGRSSTGRAVGASPTVGGRIRREPQVHG